MLLHSLSQIYENIFWCRIFILQNHGIRSRISNVIAGNLSITLRINDKHYSAITYCFPISATGSFFGGVSMCMLYRISLKDDLAAMRMVLSARVYCNKCIERLPVKPLS